MRILEVKSEVGTETFASNLKDVLVVREALVESGLIHVEVGGFQLVVSEIKAVESKPSFSDLIVSDGECVVGSEFLESGAEASCQEVVSCESINA